MSGGGDSIAYRMQQLLLAFEHLATSHRRQLGISMTEETVLLLLAQGMNAPSQVSRAIGMTTAGMTNMLDRLEAAGLVRREQHADDRRRVLLTLTKKGFQAQLLLEEACRELEDLLGAHGERAIATVDRFLRESVTAVERRAERFPD